MKDVKLAVGTMGPLPTKQDREDLMVRLQAVRTALTPRIQELREAEEWKRWANVAGAGRALHEDGSAHRRSPKPSRKRPPNEMRTLQERWKPVAAAPRSQAETLWTRFKAAQDQVYDKCKDFFAQQAAERVENLKKKEALCVRAESLSDSTDWVKTADAIKQLQAEWKAIGPVTRGNEKAVWERFRAACDKFFTRRQDDLEAAQAGLDREPRRRRRSSPKPSSSRNPPSGRRRRRASSSCRSSGRAIGPVKKSKSDAIWQRVPRRVRPVLRALQEPRSGGAPGQDGRSRNARSPSSKRWCRPPMPADAPRPDDLYAKVQAARARWVQGPELPRHTLAPLADRVNAAIFDLVTRWPDGFKGTDLDPEQTKGKMEKLVAKVEKLLPTESAEPAKNLSPAELLARQWREALAANTMGAGAARQAEDARQRAAEQEVRSAQSAWARLGPLAPDERKPLQDRFDRAVRKFSEMRRRSAARA